MKERQKGFDLGWLSDCRNEMYGFAILWVMVFHGFDWNHLNYSFGVAWLKPLSGFINLGNSGVDIFLLLSGISLYFSFSRRPEVPGFYKKRYQRLYPPLWIVNGAYWIGLAVAEVLYQKVEVVRAGGHLVTRATQLSFWFGGDRQAWYVAAIALFYFTYPFVYHFLYDDEKKTGRRTALLVLGTIAALLSIRAVYSNTYEQVEIALTRFPIFFLGCGLGKLVYERRKISWWWLILPATVIVGVLTLHFLGYFRFEVDGAQTVFHLRKWLNKYALWRYVLSLFGFSMTFFLGIALHYLSWKPLHAVLKFFGNMSLELYLAHVTVHHIARLNFWWGADASFTFAQYYIVIAIAIPVAFVTMKIENALFSKKSKKEPSPAA